MHPPTMAPPRRYVPLSAAAARATTTYVPALTVVKDTAAALSLTLRLSLAAATRPSGPNTSRWGSASGPVALGRAVDFLFSNPRDRSRSVLASSFRYSFDFNNDGDFTDPGEVLNGTSLSARHTFTRRGWHIIHGRVRAADGRFTDVWLRVFVA